MIHNMKRIIEYDITLKDELENQSQVDTAQRMGVSKGAVWLMVRDGREILLKRTKGGFKYFEVKEYDRHGAA